MKNVEDIYPLTPVQQGMLFHCLESPGAGLYVNQCSCRLRGELDAPTFRRAWQEVIDRHPVLRTAFVWEKLKQPRQVVRRRVEASFEQEDWRRLSPAEQRRRFVTYLESRRQGGFDLARAPLMHLALLRCGDDLHRFVWTFHHLLLDGWSTPLLFEEVVGAYAAYRSGRMPGAPLAAQSQPGQSSPSRS